VQHIKHFIADFTRSRSHSAGEFTITWILGNKHLLQIHLSNSVLSDQNRVSDATHKKKAKKTPVKPEFFLPENQLARLHHAAHAAHATHAAHVGCRRFIIGQISYHAFCGNHQTSH
jgi:hypothetical protein